MKLLVIQNSSFQDLFSIGHTAFAAKLEIDIPFRTEKDEKNLIRENHYFFEALEKLENSENAYDGIVISHWLYPGEEGVDQEPYIDNNSYFSAVQLAAYIRLSKNQYLRNSPILIVGPHTVEYTLKESIHRPDILFASFGTTIKVISEIDWELEGASEEKDLFDVDEFKPSLISIFETPTRQDIELSFADQIEPKLIITDRSTSGHDVANHFGAYRLAEMLGKEGLIETPKNLFFRYLISKTEKVDSSVVKRIPKNFEKLNVLVIDDQIENGWLSVLNEIFKKGIVPKKEWKKDIEEDIQSGKFDLILLDYRLKDNSGLDLLRRIKGGVERDENGKVILVRKGLNPVLPVIMFTASNKAWNMDDLYEAGADGYYVKEHPDTAGDADFSIKNYDNFIKTVEKCIKKGALLKHFWQALKEIEIEFTKENSMIQEKTLLDGNESNFQGRIKERVTMFIGLLKKAFEQTDFDKATFFYSDYELAFLTLWSVLNELQEALFIKDQPSTSITDLSGQAQTKHISHPFQPRIKYFNLPFKKHYRWQFKGKTFLSYKYGINTRPDQPEILHSGYYNLFGEERSSFYLDLREQVYGFLQYEKKWDVPYATTLHMQIAFLIKTLDQDSQLLNVLLQSNEIRNKLYLTHGGNPNSHEFSSLHSSGREPSAAWETRIRDLFSIVYFLCTAQEWKQTN